ncbi:hypothetical protein KXW40_009429 [Aspergillus fumigatus]|nr:hypothetical protein KXX58_000906 [Aspergillus fumigatus]KAH1666890.1 hypothetical protein KXX65_009625 [Aspergillus fumigatus]KAH1859755.1 hypothetical protein KXX54_006893 [Aspergillus fumigatus]KAH2034726.1 hypothetical protein KXV65_000260 [Aspergillus fumigatus]KAH2041855.1 hypothetical protein KXW51_000562 [Aspergillus fumigatus]
MTINTACSGSLVVAELACQSLVSNDTSAAILAGANIILNPERLVDGGQSVQDGSPSGHFLSRGRQASRYGKGEDVNAVFLKRLDHALRDGPDSQAACIRAAYAMANLKDFETTAYIECHGMDTTVGESSELKGISAVFGQARSMDNPLIVGSIKSNLGDSEATSGLSGLIGIVLSIEEGSIPGTPSYSMPSSKGRASFVIEAVSEANATTFFKQIIKN